MGTPKSATHSLHQTIDQRNNEGGTREELAPKATVGPANRGSVETVPNNDLHYAISPRKRRNAEVFEQIQTIKKKKMRVKGQSMERKEK
jgi:hypothetical protein